MGPYLSKPKTEVSCTNGHDDRFTYCTAEMQGWRKTQEDAHVSLLNYDDKGTAFFAVFDGHGGDEISRYCALHFPEFIKNSTLYKENKIKEALEECFLKFDQSLKWPDVMTELNKLASLDGPPEEIDETETTDLKKEAALPLEEIITRNIDYICDSASKNESDGEDEKKNIEEKNEEAKNGEEKVKSEDTDETQKEKQPEEKQKQEAGSSSSSPEKPKSKLRGISGLLRAETLQAFLNDYDEDSDDEEESDLENGDAKPDIDDSEDDEDDDEENEDEDNDDDDGDDDDDDDDRQFPSPLGMGIKGLLSPEYNEPGKGSGCTAIVALVRGDDLYVANVGDSRCILSREGVPIEMSEDHKPEDPKEYDRIVKAGGEVTDGRVNGGLNLSRAIGDHMYKNNTKLSDREQMITALPDIRTVKVDPEKDDFLFLACDGIWNSMNNQEVADFINERLKKNVDLKSICEELFRACLAPNTDGDGSGCDNMTCILVRIRAPAPKSSNGVKRAHEEGVDATDNSEDHQKDQESSVEAGPSESKKSKTVDSAQPSTNNVVEDDLYKPGPSRT